ncbi:hypothetical protein GCM10011607_24100 [Shewanella inventionis]|uniref:Uncharacterized protein n=1 Tax=Shewanella inventionis TaxID=1738770 RepID=A0ABQ1J8C1_9GAMM|nr:hypothetical protein GCM10011607_24100 [Shewanella inventionis]
METLDNTIRNSAKIVQNLSLMDILIKSLSILLKSTCFIARVPKSVNTINANSRLAYSILILKYRANYSYYDQNNKLANFLLNIPDDAQCYASDRFIGYIST